jgi:hypothetical protein
VGVGIGFDRGTLDAVNAETAENIIFLQVCFNPYSNHTTGILDAMRFEF